MLCSASTFAIFTESGSPICVSYASRKFWTDWSVVRRLMRRMSLTRTHHATAVGPIRFSNRSNNCRLCKINEHSFRRLCVQQKTKIAWCVPGFRILHHLDVGQNMPSKYTAASNLHYERVFVVSGCLVFINVCISPDSCCSSWKDSPRRSVSNLAPSLASVSLMASGSRRVYQPSLKSISSRRVSGGLDRQILILLT